MTGHGPRLVYSTGANGRESVARGGKRCNRCRETPCGCEPAESLRPSEHRVRVRRERSGRRGKTVTVAGPLFLTRADASQLLTGLKQRCGCGGTLKPGRDRSDRVGFDLELQGDRREPVVTWLSSLGYPTGSSGG